MAAERAKSLGLTPLVRIVAQATSGLAPKFVLMTPVEAVRRVAEKAGWELKDVDLYELNEAFAVQAVAVLNELGIDRERVNVNGGAVALGHAIGSSGSRVLTTLIYALKRRDLKRGIAPKLVLMTPVEAVRRLMKKTGWRLEDVDLVELNEAFSVQALAVIRELGLDPARVNVNGGAVALGHAIGSSGSRILTTLLYALKQRNLKRGVATLCMGGGNGLALAVERV